MFRTVSIKTDIKPEVFLPLMAMGAEVFNAHVAWALENHSLSTSEAHKDLYFSLRKQFPEVPSGLLQSTRDTAFEALKANNFEKTTRKKPTSSLRYDKRNFTLRGQQLTLSCIGPRVKVILPEFPEFFQAKTEKWKLASLTISYRHKTKQIYVNLSYKTPDPESLEEGTIQGLDRGLHHLVVTSDGDMFSNQQIRAAQRKRLFQRRKLKAKGTPSAKKRFKALSGKEKRFSRNVNHCATKLLVKQSHVTTFVLEDLSGIREQNKGRKFNKQISSWPFFQFQTFLEYKAVGAGKKVFYIDPRYTSQECNACGHIDRKNRKRSKFHCIKCGHQDHADKNAAKNIRDRYKLSVSLESGTTEQGEKSRTQDIAEVSKC